MDRSQASCSPSCWWRRHPRWALAAALTIAALLLLAVKLMIDWPAVPDPVPREVQQAAAGRPDLVGTAYVYDCWGNFIDSQHLWRVEISPDLIPALVRTCRLRELGSADEVPDAFWYQLPCWWRPSRTGPGRYFISPEFRADARGPDGNHYLLVYDEAAGVLYGWHKDNF